MLYLFIYHYYYFLFNRQGFILLVQSDFHTQMIFRSCERFISITEPYMQSGSKMQFLLV